MTTSIKHILNTAAAFGLVIGLTGCTRDMNYTGAETPKRNEVQMVRLVHDVRLGMSDTLSATEHKRLNAFLDGINVQYGDRLSADFGEEESFRMRNALRHALKERGLKLDETPVVSGALPLPGTGRLVVDRYTVTTPECKPFKDQTPPDNNYAEGINYGCSTTSLLGLMVADKRDLIEGKQDTAPDAATATKAVTSGRK